MYTIGIFFEGKGWTEWRVDGCEAAYDAYRKACDLAEAIGADNCAIWDTVTTEVLADMASDEEDYEENWKDLGWEIPLPEAGDLLEAWWEG